MTNLISQLRDAVAAGYGFHVDAGDARALLAEIDGLSPEPRENPQWTPEEIERAMKQWSGIPLCSECFRPQLYCACAIKAALRANRGASRD